MTAPTVAEPWRDEVATLKGRLTKAEVRIGSLEEGVGGIKVARRHTPGTTEIHTAAPEKPTLAEGEPVTDDFIQRKVLHQLYTLKKWNGTHTNGEKFKSGELRGVDGTRIERVVSRMVRQALLIAHGKRPDEEYSLNPPAADRIYQLLGIERDRSGPEPVVPPAPARDEVAPPAYVEEGTFHNTVRQLRDEIAVVRKVARQGADVEQVVTRLGILGRQIEELDGRAAGVDALLNQITQRLEVAERRIAEVADADASRSKREAAVEADEETGPQYWDLVFGAAAHAAVLQAVGPQADAAQVSTFVARARESMPSPVVPSTQVGLGMPGACTVRACDEPATGVALAADLTRGRAWPLAAPVCAAHLEAPPPIVRVEGGLDRVAARKAVDHFRGMRESFGLPATKRLQSTRVQFEGSEKARKQWDLAARAGR